VDLSFHPNVESVSAVREFLEVHYGQILPDPDLISRMAVTAHELLENAAKYSSQGGSRLLVEVALSEPPGLSVRVASPADKQHLSTLKETIDELQSADDPFDVYQRYLERAAKRTEGSGLGLARIYVEAGMRLELECTGDQICVHATGSAHAPGGTT
jgi:hypothetical protein